MSIEQAITADPGAAIAPECEAALIGSMIHIDFAEVVKNQRPELWRKIFATVTDADLRQPEHRILFNAIRHLHDTGKPVDGNLLMDAMRATDALRLLGGESAAVAKIIELGECVPSCANVAHYAQAVADASKRRAVISAGESMMIAARDASLPISEILERATRSLNEKQPAAYDCDVLSLNDLMEGNPAMASPIINGLLRQGEIMTLVGASKSRKSWAIMHLACAVATGGDWLGLPCRRGRVLMVDFELHRPTLADRFAKVQAGYGVNLHDIGAAIQVLPWRGTTCNIDHLERVTARMQPGSVDLLCVDPLYRCYPPEHDENSNGDAARLYARLAAIAAHLNCAMVIVHHLSKAGTAGRSVIDLGAGAGAVSRSGDVHAILRPEETDRNSVTLETVVRSFKPLPPIRLAWSGDYIWHVVDGGEVAASPATMGAEAFTAAVIGEDEVTRTMALSRAAKIGLKSREALALWDEARVSGRIVEIKQGKNITYRSTDTHARTIENHLCAHENNPGLAKSHPGGARMSVRGRKKDSTTN